jgi:hypothetical protein
MAPATGSPIHPSSMSFIAVCNPPPRNVSGAQPRRTPVSAAAATTSRACSSVAASGFSDHTCLPARIAARLASACAKGGVRFTTSSTSGSAISSSGEQARGTLCSAAFCSARLKSRSAQATSSSGSRRQPAKYSSLTCPHPRMATLMAASLGASYRPLKPHLCLTRM